MTPTCMLNESETKVKQCCRCVTGLERLATKQNDVSMYHRCQMKLEKTEYDVCWCVSFVQRS